MEKTAAVRGVRINSKIGGGNLEPGHGVV